MNLKRLIEVLQKHPGGKVLAHGFSNPHSYRGYYECLAFVPARNVTVGSMLQAAKSAVDETYGGWKGGEYTMKETTQVYLANVGCTGDELSETLLGFMLTGVEVPPEDPFEGGQQ